MHPGRARLSVIGTLFIALGTALLVFAGAGLGDTLPPTYGKTITLWGAGAMALVFLATGVAYVWAARRALDPVATEFGLALWRDTASGDEVGIPWEHVTKVRFSGWRMSPWIRNPRFYEVEVTSVDGEPHAPRVFLVYMMDAAAFVGQLRQVVGDRLELAPSVRA